MPEFFSAVMIGVSFVMVTWALLVAVARVVPSCAALIASPMTQRAILLSGCVVMSLMYTRLMSLSLNSPSLPIMANAVDQHPSSNEFVSPDTTQWFNVIVSQSTTTQAAQAAPPSRELVVDLRSFPRPAGDNGRGLHWFPTTAQSKAVVDTFIPELVAMHIKWVTFVQGLADYELHANEYLVRSLLAHGIMPVMRIEMRISAMDLLRFRRVVETYSALGVRYIQIYNEPNLEEEWANGHIGAPEQFADLWRDAAHVVVTAGGFPGLAAMSPNGEVSDLDYLRFVLERLSRSRRVDIVRRTWLSVHNYTSGSPSDFVGDEAGYARYRRYARISRAVLGEVLPMIGTEGGALSADTRTQAVWIAAAYGSLNKREPYWLVYSPWLIGNAVGGGTDQRWERAAWYKLGMIEPVVERVKQLP